MSGARSGSTPACAGRQRGSRGMHSSTKSVSRSYWGRGVAGVLAALDRTRKGRVRVRRQSSAPPCLHSLPGTAGPRAALAHKVTRGRRARRRLPLAALLPRRARGAHRARRASPAPAGRPPQAARSSNRAIAAGQHGRRDERGTCHASTGKRDSAYTSGSRA